MFGRPPCSASTAVEIHGLSMFSVPYHFDPGLDSCGILRKRKQMRVFVCIRAWAPHTKSRSMKSMKFILPRTIPCSLWIHPTSQHVLSWDQGFNCRRPLSHWKYPFWQFSAVRGSFNPRWCDVSVAWLVHLHSLARFWTLQQLLPICMIILQRDWCIYSIIRCDRQKQRRPRRNKPLEQRNRQWGNRATNTGQGKNR